MLGCILCLTESLFEFPPHLFLIVSDVVCGFPVGAVVRTLDPRPKGRRVELSLNCCAIRKPHPQMEDQRLYVISVVYRAGHFFKKTFALLQKEWVFRYSHCYHMEDHMHHEEYLNKNAIKNY